MKKISLYLSASVLALTIASPVFAATPDELQKRVDDLEATVDALRSEIADIRKQPEFKPSPAFQTSKGDYAFKVRGQIAIDAGGFSTKSGKADLNSGTDIPRARLGVDGTIDTDWQYRLEADFSKASRDDVTTGSELDVKDAYVTYSGFGEQWKVTAGQQKTPNTLERVNPSSDLLFVAVPLAVEAFTNRSTAGGDYKIGAAVNYTDINWTATGGVFGENLGAQGGSSATSKDEGWGPAARLTWAPINKNDAVLHLGASGYYRTTGGRGNVQFRTGPESTVDTSQRLVDTGKLAATNYWFAGAELAGVYGPLFLQSEYGKTHVNLTNYSSTWKTSSLDFDGGYAEVAYALTGESRPYKGGSFSRILPKQKFSFSKGGWGAWEIAARYSTVDLTDGLFRGGKETNWSGGLNWYPNNYVRVLANYIHYDAKDSYIAPVGTPYNKGDAFITEIGVIW